MKFENTFIKNLSPYKLASHKVWENIGFDNILKLDWNEATIPPSPLVRNNLKDLVEQPIFNLYPDVANSNLLNSLASYCQTSKWNVQYFGSSDYAQEYIIKCFLKDGDTALMLGPTYDNFRITCESVGAEVVFHYYEKDFEFNLIKY